MGSILAMIGRHLLIAGLTKVFWWRVRRNANHVAKAYKKVRGI
jgi:hypothetical protein